MSMHLSFQEIFNRYYEKLTEFISIRIRMLPQILEFQTLDWRLISSKSTWLKCIENPAENHSWRDFCGLVPFHFADFHSQTSL